jgi:leader peptidase (prepilin peptidase)/N-methyltransferase
LGVPLFPGRVMSRSQVARHPGGQPIASHRRPWSVGAAAAAIVTLTVAVAVGHLPLAGAAAVAMLVPAAVVDIEQRRLPDVWVGGALVVLIAALAAHWAIGDPVDTEATLRNVLGGAAAMGFPVLVMHLASPGSMGFGDAKAAVVLGAAVGTIDWRLGGVALCLAALSGSIVGVLGGQRTIAFGPFLVTSAWVALLANEPIGRALFSGGLGR